MSSVNSDRNLLFGVLALQMDFLDRDALIAAMNAWIHDKTKPLGDILVAQHALRTDERDAIDVLVQKHLDRHCGDVEKSLAAMHVPTPLREELRSVADPDVQASLCRVSTSSDSDKPSPLPSTVSEMKTAVGLRYQILRPHDKGGIGEVFVALDQELNRQVALKEIQERHADDAHSRGRFVREAEITGGLEHPGIVPVYGLGQYADGRPFYAMRFIQGETLKDAIARYHRAGEERASSPEFELRALLTRFIAVCNAIAYAHSRGVIHRDLKPSNIMLGKYGETLVVDWGMAKAGMNEPAHSASYGLPEPYLVPSLADGIETQTGAAMGTPAYMSPEQASGRLDLLGPASDIYSLGATLYTLLTGRPAIEGKDVGDILRKAQRGEWLPPRQVRADVPPALDAICRKAMAALPSARYATALELAADVEHWLADEPVSAHRERWGERSRRWMRRHRMQVNTVVGELVIALIGASVALALISNAWDKETYARKSAETKEQEIREQKEEAEAQKKEADRRREDARFNQYVAQMNLVQQEYEANNVAHVQELLDAQVPRHASEKDYRNFEWHYWQRMIHRELLTLRSGQVSFSRDGRQLFILSDIGVHFCDAATGKELRTLKMDRMGYCPTISPDGQLLASLNSDEKVICVWNTATGKELLVLKGHTNSVRGSAFSPDGRRLASADDDRTVRVWDTATGKELLNLKGSLSTNRLDSMILRYDLSFSPDGRRLALAGWSDTIVVWDSATGKELLTLKGHTGQVDHVSFSPDGRRLASSGRDWTVRVWDAANGRELLTLKRLTDRVNSALTDPGNVIFSPDSRRLASAGCDGTVGIWEASTGQELFTLRGYMGTDRDQSVSFSPDGRRLASSGRDRVLVWDAVTGQELLILKGHRKSLGRINGVSFSPDGRRLASPAVDNTVRIWDSATGQELFTFKGADIVTFSPDGRRLASAGHDHRTVRVWDSATGQELLTLEGHTSLVRCVSFSPDGGRLASAGIDCTVRVWDAAAGKELLALRGHKYDVTGVAFSPDGLRLASAGRDRTVRIWDAATGQELLTLKGDTGGVNSVSFSPDGRRLASANNPIRIWDTATGRELLTLKGHRGQVTDIAFSPDGRRLVSAGFDRTVRIWDADAGQELLTLKGHTDLVNTVSFSPDGQRLASASADGTVRVWEASSVPEAVWRQRGLVEQVDSLFGELGLQEEVLAALRKDPTLDEADRKFALKVAQLRHSEDPRQLILAARNVLTTRHAGDDAYTRALRQVDAARRLLDPIHGDLYLDALGIAQYRIGRYSDALTTLTKSARINATEEGSLPGDLAFLAMTQHQLGKKDEAKATLGRLREVMKQPPSWPGPYGDFMREAEELIEGKAADKGQ
jgi:WD40 repeat protein/serine/threonine protein kinase